jgi:hypothetical protein
MQKAYAMQPLLLPAETRNQLLVYLAERPYREVHKLIVVLSQLQQAPESAKERPALRPVPPPAEDDSAEG